MILKRSIKLVLILLSILLVCLTLIHVKLLHKGTVETDEQSEKLEYKELLKTFKKSDTTKYDYYRVYVVRYISTAATFPRKLEKDTILVYHKVKERSE